LARRKPWQELTITDDYMFKLVMSFPHICKHLIAKVLGIAVREIRYLESEKNIKNSYGGKGVRLDVYVEDDENSRFILEMQVRSYGGPELGRRSRFYQSSIDYDFLSEGEKYKTMGDAAVIFFCPFRLFDGERRMYTFRNTCQEDKGIVLDDGVTKVFLSAAGRPTDDLDADVAAFLDYMGGKLTENAFVKEIDGEIQDLKTDERKEADYMTFQMMMNEEREEGFAEGMEKGMEKGILSAIRSMMKNLKCSGEKAMELLEIPPGDREKYASLL